MVTQCPVLCGLRALAWRLCCTLQCDTSSDTKRKTQLCRQLLHVGGGHDMLASSYPTFPASLCTLLCYLLCSVAVSIAEPP